MKQDTAAEHQTSQGQKSSESKKRSDKKKKRPTVSTCSRAKAPKKTAPNSIGKRTSAPQARRTPSGGIPTKKSACRVGSVYQCPICQRCDFPTSQALGGHKSKAHPGESPDYSVKQKRRIEREPERRLHREAKTEYYRLNPSEAGTGRYNRSRLQAIKDSLRIFNLSKE